MIAWGFLLVALLAGSIGQVVYKMYAASRGVCHLLFALFCFGLTPVCSWIALQGLGVDVVYIATSLNTFIILISSKFLLGEDVNRHQVMGVLLVFAGVLIYVI